MSRIWLPIRLVCHNDLLGVLSNCYLSHSFQFDNFHKQHMSLILFPSSHCDLFGVLSIHTYPYLSRSIFASIFNMWLSFHHKNIQKPKRVANSESVRTSRRLRLFNNTSAERSDTCSDGFVKIIIFQVLHFSWSLGIKAGWSIIDPWDSGFVHYSQLRA